MQTHRCSDYNSFGKKRGERGTELLTRLYICETFQAELLHVFPFADNPSMYIQQPHIFAMGQRTLLTIDRAREPLK